MCYDTIYNKPSVAGAVLERVVSIFGITKPSTFSPPPNGARSQVVMYIKLHFVTTK